MSVSTPAQPQLIHSGTVLALGPMEIPGVDPLDPEGLVPVHLLLTDLLVRVPMWLPAPEPADTPHRLSLIWLRGGIDRPISDSSMRPPLRYRPLLTCMCRC